MGPDTEAEEAGEESEESEEEEEDEEEEEEEEEERDDSKDDEGAKAGEQQEQSVAFADFVSNERPYKCITDNLPDSIQSRVGRVAGGRRPAPRDPRPRAKSATRDPRPRATRAARPSPGHSVSRILSGSSMLAPK